MNEQPGSAGRSDRQPLDAATVTADAELLDALARGEPGPGDDHVAVMLAAWRADLAADLPAGAGEAAAYRSAQVTGVPEIRPPGPALTPAGPALRGLAWRSALAGGCARPSSQPPP